MLSLQPWQLLPKIYGQVLLGWNDPEWVTYVRSEHLSLYMNFYLIMSKWLPLANRLNTHCRKLQVAGYSNKMKRTCQPCMPTDSVKIVLWTHHRHSMVSLQTFSGVTTDIPWSHCRRFVDSLQMLHGFAEYGLWLAVWAFTQSWITLEFFRFF